MSIIHRPAQPDDLNGLLALYRELRPQDAPLRTDDAPHPAAPAGRSGDPSGGGGGRGTADRHLHAGADPGLAHRAQPFGVIEHVVTAEPYRGTAWRSR